MTDTNTGGPAFPIKQYNRNIMAFEEVCGMTLRDYFAAKAMQGMIGGNWPTSRTDQDYIAEFSYALADAMLAARSAT